MKLFISILLYCSVCVIFCIKTKADIACNVSSINVMQNGNWSSTTFISCDDGYWGFYSAWEINGVFGDCFVSSNVQDCPLMSPSTNPVSSGINSIKNEITLTANMKLTHEARLSRVKLKLKEVLPKLNMKGAHIIEKPKRNAKKNEIEIIRKMSKKEYFDQYVR